MSKQETPPRAVANSSLELGPQYRKDSPFTARMRRHQSWYRAQVLGVPFGTGPKASSSAYYGNMLQPADAERGLNFLDAAIHRVALVRLQRKSREVERFRLLHNMLSSQPLCFNLFAPLHLDMELATRLLRALPQLDVARVTSVELEYAPAPATEYLADGTSFDAFIDYERADGSRAFLGIEVKLTEPFSRDVYDGPKYRRWMSDANVWSPDAAQRVAALAHNQLWRDHLLAVALRDHTASPYAHGALMLVRHPEDSSCANVTRGYQQLLASHDTFIDMPLDQLVAAWARALAGDARRSWLSKLEQRYLDLSASEVTL